MFHENGEIKRVVYPHRSTFYRSIIESPLYSNLNFEYGLVDTEIQGESQQGLVLRHQKLPVTYCTEWCPSMLKDAALATLDLNIKLLDEKMTLQDASPWNILFEATKPRFVDLTSIVENAGPYLWKPYKQFLTLFYYPLLTMTLSKGDWARLKITNPHTGMSAADVCDFVGFTDWLKSPLRFFPLWLEKVLDSFLQKRQALKVKLRSMSEKSLGANVNVEMQKKFLRGLRKKIEGLQYGGPAMSKFDWENYYKNQDAIVEYQAKLDVIGSLLEKMPQKGSLLDLGCNTGRFSMLAEQKGFQVISVDGNEECVETLYACAKAKKLNILPLVADVSNPVSSYGFESMQFPNLLSRLQSDVTLFLGIMHHIHVNGNQPFYKIARMLAGLTRKTLIFEYVDMTDDNMKLLDYGREIAYTLDDVKAALGKHFTVSVHDSDRASRKILLCQKI